VATVGALGILISAITLVPSPVPVSVAAAHSVCDAAAGGGTTQLVEISGVYHCLHVFDAPGSSSFSITRGLEVEVLIVGGGGGGGGSIGGGGGAGEFIERTDGSALTLASEASPFTIVVGGGGTGGSEGSGSDGQDSSAFGLVAQGGGGGGTLFQSGRDGGSGGGTGAATAAAPGSSVLSGGGAGNAGGPATTGDGCRAVGGGGGGSGAAGGAAFSETSSASPTFNTGSLGGDGGSGRSSTITGTSIAYAGGGGGGTNTGEPSCLGVTGGAATSGGGAGAGTVGGAFVTAGGDARAGSGAGGGGGGNQAVAGGKLGGNGGSGVVIVRYVAPVTPAIPEPDEIDDPRLGGRTLAAAVEPRMERTGESSGTLTIGGTSGPPVQLLETPGVDVTAVSSPADAASTGPVILAARRTGPSGPSGPDADASFRPTRSKKPEDWQVSVSGATVTEVQSPGVDYNFPATFQEQGYGDLCWKIEDFEDEDGISANTYVLPLLPEPVLPNGDALDDPRVEAEYTLAKVKAGSIVSDDPDFQVNTIYEEPVGGSVVFADSNRNGVSDPGGRSGDKSISHIILCVDLNIDLDDIIDEAERKKAEEDLAEELAEKIAQTLPVPLDTPIILQLEPLPGSSGTELATVEVVLTSGLQQTVLTVVFNPTTFAPIASVQQDAPSGETSPPVPTSIPAGGDVQPLLPISAVWLIATLGVLFVVIRPRRSLSSR
jgi:hypothetical protein